MRVYHRFTAQNNLNCSNLLAICPSVEGYPVYLSHRFVVAIK